MDKWFKLRQALQAASSRMITSPATPFKLCQGVKKRHVQLGAVSGGTRTRANGVRCFVCVDREPRGGATVGPKRSRAEAAVSDPCRPLVLFDPEYQPDVAPAVVLVSGEPHFTELSQPRELPELEEDEEEDADTLCPPCDEGE